MLGVGIGIGIRNHDEPMSLKGEQLRTDAKTDSGPDTHPED